MTITREHHLTPVGRYPRPAGARERRLVRCAAPAPKLAGLAVQETAARGWTQHEALERLGLARDEFAQGIFARSGVHRRELNFADDFLASSLQGRTARVEEALLREAICAVDRLEIDPATLGAVLTSSLYSLGCPSLAHRLVDHYALDAGTDKYHLTAVGCASAVPLVRLGAQILQADPSREVLVVAAECMSSILVPSTDRDPRVKTVGSAIFGDGCAAALLSTQREVTGPAILATAVHQIPGTLDAVTLNCDEVDSHLDLSRELPGIAAEGLPALLEGFLVANGIRKEQIAHWMLHPGGRRIVEEARDALDLTDEDVALSWRALAEHGNVGTPSIFYVLSSTIANRSPRREELGLAITIGPGVTVGLMLISF